MALTWDPPKKCRLFLRVVSTNTHINIGRQSGIHLDAAEFAPKRLLHTHSWSTFSFHDEKVKILKVSCTDGRSERARHSGKLHENPIFVAVFAVEHEISPVKDFGVCWLEPRPRRAAFLLSVQIYTGVCFISCCQFTRRPKLLTERNPNRNHNPNQLQYPSPNSYQIGPR